MSIPASASLVRLGPLKSLAEFGAACASLGVELPAEAPGAGPSPLAESATVVINGKRRGNRIVIHPMEGWDGTATGGVSDEMRRRWRRFASPEMHPACRDLRGADEAARLTEALRRPLRMMARLDCPTLTDPAA